MPQPNLWFVISEIFKGFYALFEISKIISPVLVKEMNKY
jgi:hypothetical protein